MGDLNNLNYFINKESEKIKFYINSDEYYKKFWSKIDNAKDSIYIITYCMDHNTLANITLNKLIK